MTVSVLAAAKRMCARSGWSLSNLELQKLLYIAHMFHLGEHGGDPLVSGAFEAWDYGPVHPQLYHRVKVFGADAVENVFNSVPEIPPGADAAMLDAAVDQLGHAAPGKLVAITHWDKGAWAKYYVRGQRGTVIPNEAILQEYRDRANVLRASRTAA
jgi:uncharacterized phage-associated protein